MTSYAVVPIKIAIEKGSIHIRKKIIKLNKLEVYNSKLLWSLVKGNLQSVYMFFTQLGLTTSFYINSPIIGNAGF